MKLALIILACLAVVLGVISYFAVFSGTQVIEPVASSGDQTSSVPMLALPTSSASTTSSTLTALTSITSSTASSVFATIFSAPYPMTWSEGEAQLAVTGVGLEGDQLTFTVNVQLGSSAACVPIDLRMVTDEEGDMAAPTYPTTANFPLASDGTCEGTASESYPGQTMTFSVDAVAAPFLFTTGGASNAFFEVATTSAGGLTVTVPQQSG